jgi:lipopolysaccharide heptosyltransferase I
MIAAPDRLLIVKPSSFGDIIHALPVLELLQHQWPRTAIDWLVKEEWAELLLGQPAIDKVLIFPKNFKAWRALKNRLRQTRYNAVIDLQGLLRSGIASLMTGAPVRIGFADSREGSCWCYTTRIEPSRGSVHAVERNLDLLRQIGFPAVTAPTFPLPTSCAADDWLESLWRKEHLDHPEGAVVIHPAARWKTKRWPAKRFAEVGDRLSAAHSARIFLIAGSEQSAQASEVVRHMQCRAVNLAGITSLPQLMALLRRASLLISNDSGPMHLAAALGSPVIGIFGPTDPRRVGPYGAVNVALKKNFLCSGCSRQRCTHAQECLRAISVDEVVENASTMLRRGMTREESAAAPSGDGIRP